jgi:hypothetical protein
VHRRLCSRTNSVCMAARGMFSFARTSVHGLALSQGQSAASDSALSGSVMEAPTGWTLVARTSTSGTPTSGEEHHIVREDPGVVVVRQAARVAWQHRSHRRVYNVHLAVDKGAQVGRTGSVAAVHLQRGNRKAHGHCSSRFKLRHFNTWTMSKRGGAQENVSTYHSDRQLPPSPTHLAPDEPPPPHTHTHIPNPRSLPPPPAVPPPSGLTGLRTHPRLPSLTK